MRSVVFQLDIHYPVIVALTMRENPTLKLDKLPPDVFLIELRMQMHNFIENKTSEQLSGNGTAVDRTVSGDA